MGELAGRTILLVDEAAVSMALSPGRLEAAGLDVQLHEPPDPANPAAEPTRRHGTAGVQRDNLDPRGKNMLELFDGVFDPGYIVNTEAMPNRRNA